MDGSGCEAVQIENIFAAWEMPRAGILIKDIWTAFVRDRIKNLFASWQLSCQAETDQDICQAAVTHYLLQAQYLALLLIFILNLQFYTRNCSDNLFKYPCGLQESLDIEQRVRERGITHFSLTPSIPMHSLTLSTTSREPERECRELSSGKMQKWPENGSTDLISLQTDICAIFLPSHQIYTQCKLFQGKLIF